MEEAQIRDLREAMAQAAEVEIRAGGICRAILVAGPSPRNMHASHVDHLHRPTTNHNQLGRLFSHSMTQMLACV